MTDNKKLKIEPIVMPMRLLGNSGLKVSVLSFGSWVTFQNQVDSASGYDLMKKAFELGINFFDTAETYAAGKAEVVMGESIQMGITRGVWAREDLVISTKIFFGTKPGPNNTGLSRKHIIEGTNASLKRLQLSYVDVIFCHRPDPVTPMEEICRAMNQLIATDKAFYWATSEWSATEITEAINICDRLHLCRPICDQPQYNLCERARVEIEYQPLYRNYSYGTTIWSPLASGILTGKYSGKVIPQGTRLALSGYEWLTKAKLEKSEQFEIADKLKPVAEEIGCSVAQLAIAWVVSNKAVSTCILGATSIKQLEENIESLRFVDKVSEPAIIAKIEAICNNKPSKHTIHQQVQSRFNDLK